MRRLHGRQDSHLREARNILRIDDLGMFDAPSGLFHRALLGRNVPKGGLVESENLAISAVPNSVRPNLHSLSQGLLKHWQQLLVTPFKETACVVIRILFQECGPFGAQRAIEADFDRTAR